jgi:penicillin-binding protein 1B
VDQSGNDVWSSQPQTKKLLDPRVNFLVVSLMEEVLRTGTGAGVRARGFTLPAAGKTGTEHDAWFAGFTSKLLCVVWVGLDDYQDLKLDGAKAAVPIWTDFMKHAHQHRAYRDVTDFQVPSGIVSAQVDADTGLLATSACAHVITEYYILGTQPIQFCPLHQGGSTEIAGWETAPANSTASRPMPPAPNVAGQISPAAVNAPPDQAQSQLPAGPPPKKKSFFDKLKNIFH